MPEYLDRIAEFAAGLTYDQLPAEVVRRAKEVTADTLAVIGAGAREPEVRQLTARLVGPRPDGPAMLLGDGRRTDPQNAALINGTAGTFLELDEGNQFARGHPAIHVVPAALAWCEAHQLGGRDFITALVLGYEIGSRIGIAAKIRMSMHPHGTWGTVGAAAAAGWLDGLNAAGMKEIVNVSSCLGLTTSRQTMLQGGTVRNLYAGASNHLGLLALHLVRSGFTGERDGLTTVYGQVISETFDQQAMTEDLGTRYEIARNYFKKHACCRYNHSVLDALEIIAAGFDHGRIPVDRVQRVDVATYSLAAQLCDQSPTNMLAAKFSVPFAVAAFLTHGRAGIECFRQDQVNDPDVQALADRVFVTEDPELTAMMPGQRPSRVTIHFEGIEDQTAETFVNKGDFEDPYPLSELTDKYYDLAEPVWGRNKAESLLAHVTDLELIPNLAELTRILEN